jgi:hypothetical protein
MSASNQTGFVFVGIGRCGKASLLVLEYFAPMYERDLEAVRLRGGRIDRMTIDEANAFERCGGCEACR